MGIQEGVANDLRGAGGQRQRVVPHDQLLAKGWGYEYREETHYLRLYINYLRQKLEEDPANPRYILTERGVGYRFVDYKRQKA